MIPFKPKTCVAILILVCLSGNCASQRADREESRDARTRSTENWRQTRNVVISKDVRADSRQSRIDSSDIRTDFREIRTELPDRRFGKHSEAFRGSQTTERRIISEAANRRSSGEASRQTREEARSDLRDREASRRVSRDENRSEREANRSSREPSEASRRMRDREATRKVENNADRRSGERLEASRTDLRDREANRRMSESDRRSEDRLEASRTIGEAPSDLIRDREASRRVSESDRRSRERSEASRTIREARTDSRDGETNRRQSENRIEAPNTMSRFSKAEDRQGAQNLPTIESNNSLIKVVQAILLVALAGQLLGPKKGPIIGSWPIFAKVY